MHNNQHTSYIQIYHTHLVWTLYVCNFCVPTVYHLLQLQQFYVSVLQLQQCDMMHCNAEELYNALNVRSIVEHYNGKQKTMYHCNREREWVLYSNVAT